MNEWIRAKDRLPTTAEDVLVIASGKPKANITLKEAVEFAAYVKGDGWIVDAYPEWADAEVTHWMPLPEPPGRE